MKPVLLAVIAFLIIGAGILFYYFYTKTVAPKPGAVIPPQGNNAIVGYNSVTNTFASPNTIDSIAVNEFADTLYNNYINCMKSPPAAASGQVSVYCQNNTGVTSANFASNLEKGGAAKSGIDPIFCAQSEPSSLAIDPNTLKTATTATVYVNEKFSTKQVKVTVALIKDNGKWKVDNILCPTP